MFSFFLLRLNLPYTDFFRLEQKFCRHLNMWLVLADLWTVWFQDCLNKLLPVLADSWTVWFQDCVKKLLSVLADLWTVWFQDCLKKLLPADGSP